MGGDWDIQRRVLLEDTDKHISIVQRYVHGLDWKATDLFRHRYTARLRSGKRARGQFNMRQLVRQYERLVDPLFDDMRVNGFREFINGQPVPLPKVHVARDGELMLGNQGNHRVAMAKVLDLEAIVVRVRTVHEMMRNAA